ncbi:hypothetical protein EPA93_28485 [Ktedonosporobacter rubrisoli]|uniref:Inositol monophosphatase n=1 Tax=Ktedonosporobacter rubrisoli TaxID=2509675 RepID=A0A4P6JWE1_KTERU|nr:inositol monophosphatase family protein [Ktedonosporobacter rubrisoli]QBD79702.1 hypothetical protein EPA93_28485 [Ktedonosporobacter rubrisoli]
MKRSSIFFIPDFTTKRQPATVCLRNALHLHCRRVLDTWSPALDWCLVASGKAESVITVSEQAVPSDAGLLILQEAGGKVTDFAGKSFTLENSGRLIASNATTLHHELLKLAKRCC